MSEITYGVGVGAAQFYAPAFTWVSDGDDRPNYVVVRNPTFAAPTPEAATVLGHLADICGFSDAYKLHWGGDWALITMTSGPFALGRIRDHRDPAYPPMEVAIIQGPILDQMIEKEGKPATGLGAGDILRTG